MQYDIITHSGHSFVFKCNYTTLTKDFHFLTKDRTVFRMQPNSFSTINVCKSDISMIIPVFNYVDLLLYNSYSNYSLIIIIIPNSVLCRLV